MFKSRYCLRRTILSAGVVLLLAGCMPPIEKPLGDYEFTDRGTPDEAGAVGNRRDITPVTVLPTDADFYRLVVDEPSDSLPDVKVGPLVADNVPLISLLDIMTSEHGIALSVDQSLDNRVVRLRDPKVRPLREMLDMIAENAGVFMTYHSGVLRVSPEISFNITVPKVEDNVSTVAQTLSSFGATGVQVDTRSSIISFKADRNAVKAINPYLRKSREATDLIVYDTWFLEVSLNNSHELGIDWTQLGFNSSRYAATFAPVTASTAPTTTSTSGTTTGSSFNLGLMADPGMWLLQGAVKFLDSQGVARSLSKPTMTLISGGQAQFQVGERIQYISDTRGGITTNGVSSTGATTSDLDTGLNVQLGGSFTDGVIVTDIQLQQDTLVNFQSFSDGQGGTLQLPHTQRRQLQTSVQARPGDLVVIAGLIQNNYSGSEERVPVGSLVTDNAQTLDKSEIVIFIRPRVVQFRPTANRSQNASVSMTPVDGASAPVSH